ncbi:hypothetical protein BAUCODRAFT_32520 [Baudoinia panamericana UAMH 10762]|uniref:Chromosome condensation protein n=1 Tax=Baudoinia panamericana (strain UAMH 10762) TaxID=717646 RepID=M2NHH3_BAUPA|nr:uncharacterized protein BAUCODRAFT_32520 [Baudoinia panamericana UAMH 10762]EMC98475.1 hypothetical protein BAUCODRAFT_32520 [Baudoinia panamericana UAMH 10762]
MADFSRFSPEPKTLVEQSSEDEDNEVRASTSTASQRESHFQQQRVGRRSPPSSRDNQPSEKAQGKQPSYREPSDYQNLDEVAVSEPATREGPSSLEQGRAQQIHPKARQETNQQSYRDTVRRRVSSRHQPAGSTGAVIPPPIPPSEPPTTSSTYAEQRSRTNDPESGDADDEESLGAPTPFISRRPEDYIARQKALPPVPRSLTELYTISYLIFFAILGTLARLGMQWLTFYPGAPIVTPVIWANFAGSLFLGFLAEDQGLFSDSWSERRYEGEKPTPGGDLDAAVKAERSKRKKAIPLYIGLATGFCGSFTSFSSFARDFFLALSNSLPTPINHPSAFVSGTPSTTTVVSRNGGYSFEAWAAIVIMTVALSVGGIMVGAHFALFLDPITPRIPNGFIRRFLDPLMVFLGWGSWLGAVFLAIWPPDRPAGPASHGSWSNETWRGQVLFALVFAPVGCIIRFYASLKLNSIVPSFPLGTFAVNMLGTAIEGMCYDIQHVGVGVVGMAGGGRVGCQVLQGVMDGFCGCLTTVSTWVAEIHALKRRHGYLYAFASVVGALCLNLVIMGPVRWTVGFSTAACNTGYPNKTYR